MRLISFVLFFSHFELYSGVKSGLSESGSPVLPMGRLVYFLGQIIIWFAKASDISI